VVKRSYTPVTDERGYFEIMVKVYPDGVFSQYLHGLKIGDKVKMRG